MIIKNSLVFLAIIFSLSVVAQTAEEHFQNGFLKHQKQNYKGAIKDYDKAIKSDKSNKDVFYNRGSCKLALKDFEAAKADFSKVIKLDPSYVMAYYNRASVYVSMQKYSESLPDLDKTIELDPTTPNALTLRGQIRAQTGDPEGACEDLNRAKEIGDKQADKYLALFCGTGKDIAESLRLDWPDSEGWIVGDDQENDQRRVIDLIHSDEKIDNWTELGNMTFIKGVTGVPVEKAMNLMMDQSKEFAPKAKLTFIEKDENAKYPWIIFIIESPRFKNDKRPESQLWYIVQGKQGLYTNFRAIKKATIPEDLKRKWTAFFKTGKIVNP